MIGAHALQCDSERGTVQYGDARSGKICPRCGPEAVGVVYQYRLDGVIARRIEEAGLGGDGGSLVGPVHGARTEACTTVARGQFRTRIACCNHFEHEVVSLREQMRQIVVEAGALRVGADEPRGRTWTQQCDEFV